MRQTASYGLSKPEKTDSVSIDVLNENMDKVDAALKELSQETAASIHGSGHAAGGADPITPDMIEAADNALSNLPDPAAALARIGAAGNPNLLDNWYLADPIDQRQGYVVPTDTPYYSDTALTTQAGAVSNYTKAVKVDDTYGTITVDGTTYYVTWSAAVRGYGYAAGRCYTIDGWCLDPINLLLLNDGYVTLASTDAIVFLQQYLEGKNYLMGCAITFSVLYRGDSFSTRLNNQGGKTFPASEDWALAVNTLTITSGAFSNGRLNPIIRVSAGAGIDIKAVKLELGSNQTLAHEENGSWLLNDPPPNKSVELLKCCMNTADTSDDHANNRMTPAALGAAAMEVVSYVGTGLHGADNPCQATFSFAPKLVLGLFAVGSSGAASFFPSATNYNDYSVSVDWAMLPEQMTTQWQSGAGLGRSASWGSYWLKQYGKKSADGKTLYWYQDDDGLGNSEGASFQLNSANTTYYLIAFA